MMQFWLGPEGYGPFLQGVREGGPPELSVDTGPDKTDNPNVQAPEGQE
jgi:hypothetical protein